MTFPTNLMNECWHAVRANHQIVVAFMAASLVAHVVPFSGVELLGNISAIWLAVCPGLLALPIQRYIVSGRSDGMRISELLRFSGLMRLYSFREVIEMRTSSISDPSEMQLPRFWLYSFRRLALLAISAVAAALIVTILDVTGILHGFRSTIVWFLLTATFAALVFSTRGTMLPAVSIDADRSMRKAAERGKVSRWYVFPRLLAAYLAYASAFLVAAFFLGQFENAARTDKTAILSVLVLLNTPAFALVIIIEATVLARAYLIADQELAKTEVATLKQERGTAGE